MKNKFEQVLNFLRAYKTERIYVEFYGYDSRMEWNDPYVSIRKPIPSTIMNIIVEIVEKYETQLFKNAYSENDYYTINVNIYPFEKKMELRIKQEENGGDGSGYERDLEPDSFILKYMNDNNVNEITAIYNGAGDSGDLMDLTIDGRVYTSARYWGEPNNDEDKVFHEIYEHLENAYGGWEIDDGAEGNIIIEDGAILIEHIWHTREMVDSGYEIILTKDNIDNNEE